MNHGGGGVSKIMREIFKKVGGSPVFYSDTIFQIKFTTL